MSDRTVARANRQRIERQRKDDDIYGAIANIRDLNYDPIGEAANLLAAHVADPDPHTDYTTTAELSAALAPYAPLASPPLTGNPTAPTQAPGNNTTRLANTAFVQAAIAALVASAPGVLDTLDELAAALGDDANFAATMTTALAGKQAIDATLTALAGANWAANSMPIGTGVDTLAQTALAANQFFARSSAGNIAAKAITDAALAALANMTAATAWTPTIVGTTAAGVGTYATQVGTRVSFGILTFFSGSIAITAHTGTGNMRIGGLHAASAMAFNNPVAFHSVNNLTLTANNVLTGGVLAGSTEIQLAQYPVGGGAFAAVPLDTAFGFQFSGWMITA